MTGETATIICPRCGSPLRLVGTIEALPTKSDVSESDIVNLFPQSLRANLEVVIDGNFAKVTWKGKFDKKKFNKTLAEVKGYGGEYVKGFFKIPIAGV